MNDLTRVGGAEGGVPTSDPGHLNVMFAALGSAVNNGVIVLDSSGRHRYANGPMSALLGPLDRAGETTPPSYVPPDQRRDFLRALTLLGEGSSPIETSIELVRIPYGRVLVSFTAIPWIVDGEPFWVWIAREAYAFETQSGAADEQADSPMGGEIGASVQTPFDSVVHTLTPREHEIMLRLLVGSRVDSIARRLGISSNTVRNHLKSIFRKLEVHSQQEAIDRFRLLPVTPSVVPTAPAAGVPVPTGDVGGR